MGFFTNNWGMANAFSDPQVGRQQQITPGAGALSSTQNLNPAQWNPNQFNTQVMPQVQNQTNWGAPNQPVDMPQQDNWNNQNHPWWWLNKQNPTQGQQRGVSNAQGISSDGSYTDGGYQGQGADRSPQGYQDYFGQNRGIIQGAGAFMGPVGGLFGLAADYNMGFNTFSPNKGQNLGFNNPFTGNYTSFYNDNYQGPGSDEYANMNPSEQRDMMINQYGYDTRSPQDESFLEGLFTGNPFGGNQLNYDPDLDLGLDSEGNPQDADDWIDWNDPDDFGDEDFDGNGFDSDGDDGGDWGDFGDAESDMDSDSGWSGSDSDFGGDW